jgi:hypothetical protein
MKTYRASLAGQPGREWVQRAATLPLEIPLDLRNQLRPERRPFFGAGRQDFSSHRLLLCVN